MTFIDRNRPYAILTAGIFALIIGVGAARFAFTALLPAMLADTLSLTFSGVLASLNYVGYLSGAVFAAFIRQPQQKVFYFRLGLLLCVGTTALLGATTHEVLWLISRVLAGFGAAMALVVGSAIVMTKLDMSDKTKAMGIHFSGIGFSIVVTDGLSRMVLAQGAPWSIAWWGIAGVALVMMCFCWWVLEFDDARASQAPQVKVDRSVFTGFVPILIFAYFTEGLGMVVQGTFLPDIVNAIPGLEGFGSYAWTLVGLAGIPSCILWMRLAHRFGSIPIIVITMLLQVAGLVIHVLSSSAFMNLLSGVFFGGTFVALVALFMHLGGKLAGDNPVVLMGVITAAYGVGQISGPLYSVALTEATGSYNAALLVTAGMVLVGALSLWLGRKRLSA